MRTVCSPQLPFSFYPHRKVIVNFKGGEITTDPGLFLLREFDHRLKLTKQMDRCLKDPRDPERIEHEQIEMLRQRLYQIVAGYEDADDADLLRDDATFKLIAGKRSVEEPLASQPTISRLENRVKWPDIEKLEGLLFKWFAQSRKEDPREILLDLDSTDDPAYGGQQLVMFNACYDQYMYHPLVLFEGNSGNLLSVLLRRGNASSAECADDMLESAIKKAREQFPRAQIRVRGDSGFGRPMMYDLCEREGIEYTVGISTNRRLKKRAQAVLARAVERHERTGKPVKCYTSFRYAAGTWPRQRKICVKAEVNSEGTNLRFLVTNRPGRAKDIFAFYNDRGECENRIKELKLGFHADRLSCSSYMANAFRLVLHSLAYNLVNLFREHVLAGTELARAQIDTLRLKLFKVGACVRQTVRRVWVQLASGWPHRSLFLEAHRRVRSHAVVLRC